MSKRPMTLRGAQLLREEREQLVREERPKIVREIAEARSHGDLKENAEYHAAKDRQGLIEARIKQIEMTLAHAEIIDVTKVSGGGRVVFGATVAVVDSDDGKELKYRIVGEDEADIKHQLISITSPIARALIGKNEGDEVVFSAPGGEKHYEVIEVRYV